MTKEQIAVLDAGLRMLQEAPLNWNTIEPPVRTIIVTTYGQLDSRTLGRKIVTDAITKTGYFAESA